MATTNTRDRRGASAAQVISSGISCRFFSTFSVTCSVISAAVAPGQRVCTTMTLNVNGGIFGLAQSDVRPHADHGRTMK